GLWKTKLVTKPLSNRIGSDGALRRPVAPGGRPYQDFFDFRAEIRNRMRKLVRPCWSFAEPKWNSRRLTFCVLHPNDTRIHTQDSPRCVSQLKDISSHTFDGEIFVDGAQKRFRRLENHSIIGVIRNGSAGCQCS